MKIKNIMNNQKLLENLPDQNPNPIIRISLDGELLYFNNSSKYIIKIWDIDIGDICHKNIFKKIKNTNKSTNYFELKIGIIYYKFSSVYINELKYYNIYATDITAVKIIDKFPDKNPNPVIRLNKIFELTYFNQAALEFIYFYKLKIGDSIIKPIYKKIKNSNNINEKQTGRIRVNFKTLYFTILPKNEFDSYIIYFTDITANIIIDKFPDENPNPVLKCDKSFILKYYNRASQYLIDNEYFKVNDHIPKDFIEKIKNNEMSFERDINEKVYFFRIVFIEEFEFFLIYCTDITESKDKELILLKLSKYFSPQIYDSIFTGKLDVKIKSTRKDLSIFFSDIVGFSTLSEKLEPENLTRLITDYLTEMTNIAIKYGGTVDKYIGDAIMVFFGDPASKGKIKDACSCISMALEMKERLKYINQQWVSSGISEDLKIRIGINTDICTVGNFGSNNRLDYTVLGNGVNLASRLESIALENQILISENTFNLIKNYFKCSFVDEIFVKGKSHALNIYTVDGHLFEKIEQSNIKYKSNGFSLKIETNKITNKSNILKLLKKAIDRLNKN